MSAVFENISAKAKIKVEVGGKQCNRCKHYIGYNEALLRNCCAAFKNGIPTKILFDEFDHRHPYPGDNGIQFEPKEETEAAPE